MPRWWTRGSRYEFMGRGWRVANCRRYSVAYAPANVCLSAPTEFLVALHIARMSAAINYSPNVATVSEHFQPVRRTIFENAIDQEASGECRCMEMPHGMQTSLGEISYLDHAISRCGRVYSRIVFRLL